MLRLDERSCARPAVALVSYGSGCSKRRQCKRPAALDKSSAGPGPEARALLRAGHVPPGFLWLACGRLGDLG